jgi:hypothetical protein
MNEHVDAFLKQLMQQGFAVVLVVAASIGFYHVVTQLNTDSVVMLKDHITEIKADKKLLFAELLECLKP